MDLFHSPEPSKLSISLYINCKRASNMVLIIFLCPLFDLDFAHLAAESYHFLQRLQLSVAILWNSMLQVSTWKTSHMGKSEMMWTWIVSYWLEQIHLRKLQSKVDKWNSTVEFHGDRTLFRVTWRSIWLFLNCGRQINICTWLHSRIQTSTPHRFTLQCGHDPRSLDVMVYVLSISINFRELVIFPLL